MTLYTARPNIPYTDRASVQQALISYLRPLVPFFSPHKATIHLGETATHYDATAADLEGFSRPLWGLAALHAGGGSHLFPEASLWVRGLVAGTDPTHPEYWGDVRDKDQRMVEMAPIGWWLSQCGAGDHGFWQTLSAREQENITNWLYSVNERSMPDTNWLWFRVFANVGLRAVGARHDAARITRDLDHLDTFYVGDGWSADGPVSECHQYDYYSGPFAIQTSQLLYSVLAADTDPVRAATYRARATAFAAQHLPYFAAAGPAIPFGRSTTYRFAMCAFWAAVAAADLPLPSLPWGAVRGVLLRNLRWWSTQPIRTPAGTLSIGYAYANQFFTENYNSPGSPYWCCKAFLCLAVPAAHPFWAEEEMPLPPLPDVVPLENPKHIVCRAAGHTFLLSSGQRCSYPLKATQAKYGKFAYSAAFAFSVPTGAFGLPEHAPDSMLALSRDGGETWAVRRVALGARMQRWGDVVGLVAGWEPWRGVHVETVLLPPTEAAPHFYARVHRIRVEKGCGGVMAAECGWSVYGQDEAGRHLPEWDGVWGCGERVAQATAVSPRGVVGIKEIGDGGRSGKVIRNDPNSNLLEGRTVMPLLEGVLGEGETVWRCAVFGWPAEVEGWREGWEREFGKEVVLPEGL